MKKGYRAIDIATFIAPALGSQKSGLLFKVSLGNTVNGFLKFVNGLSVKAIRVFLFWTIVDKYIFLIPEYAADMLINRIVKFWFSTTPVFGFAPKIQWDGLFPL